MSYNATGCGGLPIGTGYDLLIVVSSWDDRCRSLSAITASLADNAVLVAFDERDAGGKRDANDAVLRSFLDRTIPNVVEITGSATALRDVWERLAQVVGGLRASVGTPLKILIDISTCPRYYTLSLLAAGLRSGIVGQLDMVYAEGRYPKPSADNEIAFSKGHWKTVPIRGLEGWIRPALPSYFLTSIGFEGWKTLRVLAQRDPQRVSILLPDPATLDTYVGRTLGGNKTLVERYQIPPEQIIRARAGDAVGAWKALVEAKVERKNKENTYYLCTGNKPHSVAMALRAYTLRWPAVLYPLPASHRIVHVEPLDSVWLYSVTNRIVPY